MKLHLEEDVFVNKLLEETCEQVSSSKSKNEDENLADYFERRSSSFEEDNLKKILESFEGKGHLRTFECQFLDKISCFRIQVDGMELDFPKNWSFFRKVYSSYSLKNSNFIHIRPDNDQDDFLMVMLPLIDQAKELVFIIQKEKVLLSFLSGADEEQKYYKVI